MNRRTLLTSISVGAATVAGCIGKLNRDENDEQKKPNRNENDERKYEECNRRILNYRTLPEDVKTEVDTAFDEGQYESDEELLWQQVAGPGVEWLLREGTYYAPQVDVDNGVHTLKFEETTPQFETKYLNVEHDLEEPQDLSITIKAIEGNSKRTVLQEDGITIGDGGSNQKVPIASEFGKYLVEVTIEDFGTVTREVRLDPDVTIILNIGKEPNFSAHIVESRPDELESKCPWVYYE